MTLLETVNVTLALDKLTIEKAEDRFGGVEPYVVPIFFKIDGEGYEATLRILNARSPRDGTTERPPDGSFQFSVDSLHPDSTEENPVPNIPEKDFPFIFIPPGKLLGRGSHGSGSEVDVSDISFTSDLKPINFTIDVAGLANESAILNKLEGLLLDGTGDLNRILNTTFGALNDVIGDLLGLDQRFESCPPLVGEGLEDFFKNIEAQFNCLIPGTIGGIFVCMENDEFSEGLARELQDSLREEVENSINDTVNDIALSNPIPDPENFQDADAIADNIESDLGVSVGLDIALSVGALLLGVLSLNLGLAIWGFLSGLSWIFGGVDDTIGPFAATYSHTDLLSAEDPGAPIEFASDPENELKGDGNRWQLNGSLTINQ